MKMEKIILNIEGMSCNHCVKAVNDTLMAIDGVKKVIVSLSNKTAEIEFDPSKTSVSEFEKAIEEQGYDIVK
jgi:copper chaperone